MSGSELTGHGGGHGHEDEGFVQLPTPTIWPFVFALGVSLLIAGMVTHWVVSLLGVCLSLSGIVGWFRQVFPHEAHTPVPIVSEAVPITTTYVVRVPRPSPGPFIRSASRPSGPGRRYRRTIRRHPRRSPSARSCSSTAACPPTAPWPAPLAMTPRGPSRTHGRSRSASTAAPGSGTPPLS